jgi:hypothetical protein
VSDERLRELERAWATEASGENAVAYLGELLRSGEVRQLEARLAWRVARLEWNRGGVPRRMSWVNEEVLSAPFDPGEPGTAVMVLNVLLPDTGPELRRPTSAGAIHDIALSVYNEHAGREPLAGFRGPQYPFNRSCSPTRHLGPIDLEAEPAACTRCAVPVMLVNGNYVTALPQEIARCVADMHYGPMEHRTQGQVCTNCGEVVAVITHGETTSDRTLRSLDLG